VGGRGRDPLSLGAALADRRSVGLAFGLALFVASAATVDKYLGLGLTGVYLLVVLGAGSVVFDGLDPVRRRITERQALWLALVTLIILVALFALVYPHADAHTFGSGSDRDDAADLAANALRHGRYPYGAETYLGNPISQLPGGVLLAVPFEAIGQSAFAAFCWLPVFFLMLRKLAGELRSPLLLVWVALALSPVFVRELVTGGDLIANSVCVMVAAWLVVTALDRPGTAGACVAALALGLVLSWRLTFVFVVPPLLVLFWRARGTRGAVAVAALSAAAFAAVTLPFYLGHRTEFTPIGASDKLEGFNGVIPGGARAVILAGVVLSLALAVGFGSTSIRGVFAQTAVVEAFFLLAVVALASAHAATVELGPLVPGYGLPVLLLTLGALAAPFPPPRTRLRPA
jgi:hypothetical protein